MREGASTPAEIVARVYTDVSPKALAMAERAVLAHLAKLVADGLVEHNVDGNSLRLELTTSLQYTALEGACSRRPLTQAAASGSFLTAT